ncbi:CotO family spore coat protein [Priestia taiwanensis]|uniref:Spore coat protein CotO n=1 Tax=Priestia taiwanensis TaxID=1347902 RepID=A0A917AT97_9BACI|nr:CotO family spore coat protein [Priestia taiwanensis]MBM7364118.1 hypothetical protein [Priestia taiwanensis]GGE71721.1 hypothetical protein GCM10007140_22120 [Priestia taiwanensis]
MNKKGNNRPLVYITEPAVQKVSRNMQQSFYSRPNKKVKQPTQETEVVQPIEDKQEVEQKHVEEQKQVVESKQHLFEEVTKRSIYEELEELQEDVPVQEQVIEQPTMKSVTEEVETKEVEEVEVAKTEDAEVEDEEVIARKAFKDMTMEEKVLFILARPHYIPKVKCRVNTRRNWYIGYIAQLKDNVVYLKIPTRLEPISLRLDDIQSIQMIGTHES